TSSAINATAFNTVVNVYLCPSDPQANGPGGNTNSYYSCYGTTCQQPDNKPGSTGMFATWDSYGMRDLTDGRSNTIAYPGGRGGRVSARRPIRRPSSGSCRPAPRRSPGRIPPTKRAAAATAGARGSPG